MAAAFDDATAAPAAIPTPAPAAAVTDGVKISSPMPGTILDVKCKAGDAVKKGERVLLIDDLLATGGTARASAQMVEQFGGEVAEIDFLIELAFLKGREKLGKYKVFAPVVF